MNITDLTLAYVDKREEGALPNSTDQYFYWHITIDGKEYGNAIRGNDLNTLIMLLVNMELALGKINARQP